MILVRKFNKEEFYINPLMIEMIEKTPDTIITLINNKKYIVADTVEDLLESIENYYKVIGLISPQILFNSYDFSNKDGE